MASTFNLISSGRYKRLGSKLSMMIRSGIFPNQIFFHIDLITENIYSYVGLRIKYYIKDAMIIILSLTFITL